MSWSGLPRTCFERILAKTNPGSSPFATMSNMTPSQRRLQDYEHDDGWETLYLYFKTNEGGSVFQSSFS